MGAAAGCSVCIAASSRVRVVVCVCVSRACRVVVRVADLSRLPTALHDPCLADFTCTSDCFRLVFCVWFHVGLATRNHTQAVAATIVPVSLIYLPAHQF